MLNKFLGKLEEFLFGNISGFLLCEQLVALLSLGQGW